MKPIAPHPQPTAPLLALFALFAWWAFLACPAAGAAADTPDAPVVLASGPWDGVYHRLAVGISQRLNQRTTNVQTTGDSQESLERLLSGEARFAFVQEMVASEFVREHTASDVRVVGTVGVEYLHIFLNEAVHVDSLADLQRLRIWAGDEQTETRLAATHLLDIVGISLSTLRDRLVTFDEIPGREREKPWMTEHVLDQLRKGRLDAAFILDAPGTSAICRAMGSGRIALFPLDRSTLRRLHQDASSFQRQTAMAKIPRGTYPNQPETLTAVGIPMLLLARQGEDPALAREILQAARDEWQEMASRAQASGCRLPNSPPSLSLEGTGLKWLLPSAPPPRPGIARPASLLAFIALVLGAWTGWRRRWHRRLRAYWRRDKLPFLIVAGFIGGVLAITVAAYLLERDVNDNFSSIPEAFWSITVYLLSGLEDRTPYTTQGRVVVTLGLLLGPAFLAVASGWLAGVFIKRKRKMPQNLRDHYLMLNWNDRAPEVVRELHHPLLREQEGIPVIVVLTDDEKLSLRQIKEAGSGWDETFEDFFVSVGDPTDRRALLNANAQDARTILILADERHGDERTIRSLMALRRIARDLGCKIHVVAELLNAANDSVIDELADEFPGLLERVSGLRIRTCLLSQAALNPGLVSFYTDLLRVSEDTNEIFTQEIPASAVGLSFRDYAAQVLRTRSDEPLIPVGVQRVMEGKARMLTNPKPGEPGDVLEAGDRLLLIAWEPPARNALPLPEQIRAA